MSPRATSRCSEPIASMRSEAVPSRCKVGTRSSRATSSSIDIRKRFTGTECSRATTLAANRYSETVSRPQFVATGFRDQDLRIGGVLLDLLAQPVDVGFQRVRGHTGIVAPSLLEQGLARHRELAGPIEETQDRRFLLGQADLLAVGA